MSSDIHRLPDPKVTAWLDLARSQDHTATNTLHALPGPTPDRCLLLCTDLFRLHAIHVSHPLVAADDFHLPPGSYTVATAQDRPGWRLTPAPDDVRMPNFQQFQGLFPFGPAPADPAADPDAGQRVLAVDGWPAISRSVAKGLFKADVMAYFRPQSDAGLFSFHGFLPRLWKDEPDLIRLNPLGVFDALARPRYTAPHRLPYPTAVVSPTQATVRLGEWMAFALLPNVQIPPWMARQVRQGSPHVA